MVNWEWYDDPNTMRVFLHLLLTVNYEDKKWHGIAVKRGSRITSYDKISSELKLSVQKVRTAIKRLKSTGELTSETIRDGSSFYTVFAIKNYAKYQDRTSELTSEATSHQQLTNISTTSHQQPTNSNGTKINKDNKDNKYIRARKKKSGDSDTGRQFELPPGQLPGVYHINEGNDF
jgi:biotin operon repressor